MSNSEGRYKVLTKDPLTEWKRMIESNIECMQSSQNLYMKGRRSGNMQYRHSQPGKNDCHQRSNCSQNSSVHKGQESCERSPGLISSKSIEQGKDCYHVTECNISNHQYDNDSADTTIGNLLLNNPVDMKLENHETVQQNGLSFNLGDIRNLCQENDINLNSCQNIVNTAGIKCKAKTNFEVKVKNFIKNSEADNPGDRIIDDYPYLFTHDFLHDTVSYTDVGKTESNDTKETIRNKISNSTASTCLRESVASSQNTGTPTAGEETKTNDSYKCQECLMSSSCSVDRTCEVGTEHGNSFQCTGDFVDSDNSKLMVGKMCPQNLTNGQVQDDAKCLNTIAQTSCMDSTASLVHPYEDDDGGDDDDSEDDCVDGGDTDDGRDDDNSDTYVDEEYTFKSSDGVLTNKEGIDDITETCVTDGECSKITECDIGDNTLNKGWTKDSVDYSAVKKCTTHENRCNPKLDVDKNYETLALPDKTVANSPKLLTSPFGNTALSDACDNSIHEIEIAESHTHLIYKQDHVLSCKENSHETNIHDTYHNEIIMSSFKVNEKSEKNAGDKNVHSHDRQGLSIDGIKTKYAAARKVMDTGDCLHTIGYVGLNDVMPSADTFEDAFCDTQVRKEVQHLLSYNDKRVESKDCDTNCLGLNVNKEEHCFDVNRDNDVTDIKLGAYEARDHLYKQAENQLHTHSGKDVLKGMLRKICAKHSVMPPRSYRQEYSQSGKHNKAEPSDLCSSNIKAIDRGLKHLTRNPLTQWTRMVNSNIEAVLKEKTDKADHAKYGGGDFASCIFGKSRNLQTSQKVNTEKKQCKGSDSSNAQFGQDDLCLKNLYFENNSEVGYHPKIGASHDTVASFMSQENNNGDCFHAESHIFSNKYDGRTFDNNARTTVQKENNLKNSEAVETDSLHQHTSKVGNIENSCKDSCKEPCCHESNMGLACDKKDSGRILDVKCGNVYENDKAILLQDKFDNFPKLLILKVDSTANVCYLNSANNKESVGVNKNERKYQSDNVLMGDSKTSSKEEIIVSTYECENSTYNLEEGIKSGFGHRLKSERDCSSKDNCCVPTNGCCGYNIAEISTCNEGSCSATSSVNESSITTLTDTNEPVTSVSDCENTCVRYLNKCSLDSSESVRTSESDVNVHCRAVLNKFDPCSDITDAEVNDNLLEIHGTKEYSGIHIEKQSKGQYNSGCQQDTARSTVCTLDTRVSSCDVCSSYMFDDRNVDEQERDSCITVIAGNVETVSDVCNDKQNMGASNDKRCKGVFNEKQNMSIFDDKHINSICSERQLMCTASNKLMQHIFDCKQVKSITKNEWINSMSNYKRVQDVSNDERITRIYSVCSGSISSVHDNTRNYNVRKCKSVIDLRCGNNLFNSSMCLDRSSHRLILPAEIVMCPHISNNNHRQKAACVPQEYCTECLKIVTVNRSPDTEAAGVNIESSVMPQAGFSLHAEKTLYAGSDRHILLTYIENPATKIRETYHSFVNETKTNDEEAQYRTDSNNLTKYPVSQWGKVVNAKKKAVSEKKMAEISHIKFKSGDVKSSLFGQSESVQASQCANFEKIRCGSSDFIQAHLKQHDYCLAKAHVEDPCEPGNDDSAVSDIHMNNIAITRRYMKENEVDNLGDNQVNLSKKIPFRSSKKFTFSNLVLQQNELPQITSAENSVTSDKYKTQKCQHKKRKHDKTYRIRTAHSDNRAVVTGKNMDISRNDLSCDGCGTGCIQDDEPISLRVLHQTIVNISPLHPTSNADSRRSHSIFQTEKSNGTVKRLTRNPMTQWIRLVNDNLEAVLKTKPPYSEYSVYDSKHCIFPKRFSKPTLKRQEVALKDNTISKDNENGGKKLYSLSGVGGVREVNGELGMSYAFSDHMEGHEGDVCKIHVPYFCQIGETRTVDCGFKIMAEVGHIKCKSGDFETYVFDQSGSVHTSQCSNIEKISSDFFKAHLKQVDYCHDKSHVEEQCECGKDDSAAANILEVVASFNSKEHNTTYSTAGFNSEEFNTAYGIAGSSDFNKEYDDNIHAEGKNKQSLEGNCLDSNQLAGIGNSYDVKMDDFGYSFTQDLIQATCYNDEENGADCLKKAKGSLDNINDQCVTISEHAVAVNRLHTSSMLESNKISMNAMFCTNPIHVSGHVRTNRDTRHEQDDTIFRNVCKKYPEDAKVSCVNHHENDEYDFGQYEIAQYSDYGKLDRDDNCQVIDCYVFGSRTGIDKIVNELNTDEVCEKYLNIRQSPDVSECLHVSKTNLIDVGDRTNGSENVCGDRPLIHTLASYERIHTDELGICKNLKTDLNDRELNSGSKDFAFNVNQMSGICEAKQHGHVHSESEFSMKCEQDINKDAPRTTMFQSEIQIYSCHSTTSVVSNKESSSVKEKKEDNLGDYIINLSKTNPVRISKSFTFSDSVLKQNELSKSTSAENWITSDTCKTWKCQHKKRKQDKTGRIRTAHSDNRAVGTGEIVDVSRKDLSGDGYRTRCIQDDQSTSQGHLQQATVNVSQLHPTSNEDSRRRCTMFQTEKSKGAVKHLTRNPMTQWTRLVNDNLEAVLKTKSTDFENAFYDRNQKCIFPDKFSKHTPKRPEGTLKDHSISKDNESGREKLYSSNDVGGVREVNGQLGISNTCPDYMEGNKGDICKSHIFNTCEIGETKGVSYGIKIINSALKDSTYDYSGSDKGNICPGHKSPKKKLHVDNGCLEVFSTTATEYLSCEKVYNSRCDKNISGQLHLLKCGIADCSRSDIEDTVCITCTGLNVSIAGDVPLTDVAVQSTNDICVLQSGEENMLHQSLGQVDLTEEDKHAPADKCTASVAAEPSVSGNTVFNLDMFQKNSLSHSSACNQDTEFVLKESIASCEIKAGGNIDKVHLSECNSEELFMLDSGRIRNSVFCSEKALHEYVHSQQNVDLKQLSMAHLSVVCDEHSSISTPLSLQNRATDVSKSEANNREHLALPRTLSLQNRATKINDSGAGIREHPHISKTLSSKNRAIGISESGAEVRGSLPVSRSLSLQNRATDISESGAKMRENQALTRTLSQRKRNTNINDVGAKITERSCLTRTALWQNRVAGGSVSDTAIKITTLPKSGSMFNSAPVSDDKAAVCSSAFCLQDGTHESYYQETNTLPYSEKADEQLQCKSMTDEKLPYTSITDEKLLCKSITDETLLCKSISDEKRLYQSFTDGELLYKFITDEKLLCKCIANEKLLYKSIIDEKHLSKSMSAEQIQPVERFLNIQNSVILTGSYWHFRNHKSSDVTIYVHKNASCNKVANTNKRNLKTIFDVNGKKDHQKIFSTDNNDNLETVSCAYKSKERSYSNQKGKRQDKSPSALKIRPRSAVSKTDIAMQTSINYGRMSSYLSKKSMQTGVKRCDITSGELDEPCADDNVYMTGWSRFWHVITQIFTPSYASDANKELITQNKQHNQNVTRAGHRSKVHSFKAAREEKCKEPSTPLPCERNSVYSNKDLKKYTLNNACDGNFLDSGKHGNKKCKTNKMLIIDSKSRETDQHTRTDKSTVKLSKKKKPKIHMDQSKPKDNILLGSEIIDRCVEKVCLTHEKNEIGSYFIVPQDHCRSVTDIQLFPQDHCSNVNEIQLVPQDHCSNVTEIHQVPQDYCSNVTELQLVPQDHCSNVTEIPTHYDEWKNIATLYLNNEHSIHKKENGALFKWNKRFMNHKSKIPVMISTQEASVTNNLRNKNMTGRCHQKEASFKTNKNHTCDNERKVRNSTLKMTCFSAVAETIETQQEYFSAYQTRPNETYTICQFENEGTSKMNEECSVCKNKAESDSILHVVDTTSTPSSKLKTRAVGKSASITNNTVHLMDKPAAITEKFKVDTKSVSNEADLSDYFHSLARPNISQPKTSSHLPQHVEDYHTYDNFDLTESELLQSSLECLLEMLLQRGKVLHALITSTDGEVIAKTAKCVFTTNDIKSVLFSLTSSYKGMIKIAVFNDVYTCFKHDEDSLIGKSASNIFAARRGKQNVVVGFCSPFTPGSCIREVREISELLSHRGL